MNSDLGILSLQEPQAMTGATRLTFERWERKGLIVVIASAIILGSIIGFTVGELATMVIR